MANLFAKKVYDNHSVQIINPNQWRPLINVKNLCDVIAFCQNNHKFNSGDIFNVGSSQMNYTIQQMFDTVLHVAKKFDISYSHLVGIEEKLMIKITELILTNWKMSMLMIN